MTKLFYRDIPVEFKSPKREYQFVEESPSSEWTEAKYANRLLWSDVEPFEIVEIKGKRLVLRGMDCDQTAKLRFSPGGFVGHTENSDQRWEIKSNPSYETIEVSLRKNGTFQRVGSSGQGLRGFRPSDKPIKFYDYNF